MTTPTPEQRHQEKAFILTTVADTAITATLALIAIVGGSLAMLSEATRAVLLLSINFYTIWLMLGVHRGRFTTFEYGTGKLERLIFAVVGVGLLLGAYWVLKSVADAFIDDGPPASPLSLTFGALINAVNLVVNYIGWHAMTRAARKDGPGLMAAEISSRFGSLVGSAILQVTITASVLAKDPVIVLTFDAIGAVLVAFLMTRRGLKMVIAGISSLLDQPPDPDLAQSIRNAVARVVPPDALETLRMRRGGPVVYVDIVARPDAFNTVHDITSGAEEIRRALADLPDGVDVSLAVGASA
ncbi:cation diffusion facilitator family transporter [Chachezhania antarctica]|uniref:cation diffusion facilitator family transporter n=1 Tax=Chachezhania antarctica TaxID=2340860 RepID=UPI0013CEC274|nr:cation transporter [Chachezhania antarctica]